MTTLASGTWDTQSKPRSKYKLYDTTVYQLEVFHRFSVSGVAKMALNNKTGIINSWLDTDRGKYLIDIIREPEIVFQNDHLSYNTNVAIMAYITPEDLMMYKLAFGID